MEDELGYFWVATHKGLIRCTFADNMNQAYGLSDGLPGLMFNPGACYYDSKTKQFWWGNEDGLVYCNIEDLKTNEKPPPIQIIRFYVNGKEITTTTAILPKAIEMTSKIKLRQFENSFGFDFVALNYRHPNDNNFETKLDGLDKDWQLLKKGNTSAYYGGISPGKYTFNVRLMGYPESEKSITITVQRNWKVVIWLIPTLLLFFLYIVLWKKSKNNPSRKTTPQKERAVNNSIQIKDHSIKYNELLHLMQEKKPYLDPELKMPYLTGVLKCSSKELSEIFRDHIKQSFADFVNGYRIKEFKEKIEKGEHEKYTIIALSERCGFSSRSSFFRIFKKLTGSTPLEYLKQIEREPN
jgi:AraC-like DNA-binding protein